MFESLDFDSLKSRLLPGLSGLDEAALDASLRNPREAYWPAEGVHSDAFQARLPDAAGILEMADLAAVGRIRFWHPWHMERTAEAFPIGRSISWQHAPNGDIEWAHALARFTHMIDLAAAHSLAGRKSHVEAYTRYLESYLTSRLRGDESAFWENRLDAALRLANLVKSHDLLRRNSCPPGISLKVARALLLEGGFLAAGLGKHINNWEFFICTGLIMASRYLCGHFDVSGWENAATDRLGEILAASVLADGTHAEQAPMYQGEVVLCLLDALLPLRTNGHVLPPASVKAVREMATSLFNLSDPEGMIPPIGDSDRYPVAYLLRYAETVLGFPIPVEIKSETVGADPDLMSFMQAGLIRVNWPLPKGGTGWLLFDGSGKPAPGLRFHSHADDLQFLLHTSKGPILTDPGRFTYASHFRGTLPFRKQRVGFYPRGRLRPLHNFLFPGLKDLNVRDWRAWFRSSAAHNTVTAAGEDQRGYGNDREDGRPMTVPLTRSCGPMVMMTSEAGRADGTGDFRHRRSIYGLLPKAWLIVDEVEASETRTWWSSFHLGPGVDALPSPQIGTDRPFLELTGPGKGVSMHWASHGGASSLGILDEWISPVYNEKVPARTARLQIGPTRTFRSATLLWMDSESPQVASPAPERELRIEGIEDSDGPIRIVCESGEAHYAFLIHPSKSAVGRSGLVSDADFSFVKTLRNAIQEAGYLGGTCLKAGGRELQGPFGDCHNIFTSG